jgi:hypothetical protein
MRGRGRIDAGRNPPGLLVGDAVNGTVMESAERDGELVTDLESQSARLHEPEMVRIRWFAAADQAGMLGHKP